MGCGIYIDKTGNYTISARVEPEQFTYDGYTYILNEILTGNVIVKNSTYDIKADVKPGENTTITVTVPDDVTGDVTVSVNGTDYPVIIDEDGTGSVVIPLVPGNYSANVTVSDDPKYEDKTVDIGDFEVPKVVLGDDDVEADVVPGENTTITVTVPDDVTGKVTVNVNGTDYPVTIDENGTGTVDIPLTPGNYTVNVTISDDPKYEDKTLDLGEFEVKKVDSFIKVDVEPVNVGENLSVDVVVPDDATGDITLEVDNKTYISPIKNGTAKFDISGLKEGNYTVKATYAGDDKYPSNSSSVNVEVSKVKDYSMNVTVDGNDITVTLPEDAEGNVTVIVDGKNYTAEVVNGTAIIPDLELKPGKHNITVIYGDDKYSPETITSIVDVENQLLIDAPAVVKYYSGSDRFYVYLEDMNGKKIANANITIKINGVTYSRTTDENGSASIAINLNSGEYPVTVTFLGNSEFNQTVVSSSITVKPTIYADDVFKVFRNGTQYYAFFTDGKGNPLANTVVSYNINGVFYNRTTNATGWAKLNINL